MDALRSRSKFVEHGPCDQCGSKDNVAWYSNGTGYCFGCGKLHISSEERRYVRLRPDSSTSDRRVSGDEVELDQREDSIRPTPDDITTLYPPKIVKWLEQYHLSPADVMKYNVVWSESKQQLFFRFFGETPKDLILWQARNFRDGTTHKNRFFTAGLPNEVVAIYYPADKDNKKVAVVVEDCVSAMKVAKSGFHGVPCFGSGMSDRKLRRLAQMFNHIVFWLDHDKFKEATTLARKVGMMGTKTNMMYTEEDPKCFDTKTIIDSIHGKVQHIGG